MNAVFLDRDGVINKYPGDREYVKSWEEFHFLLGVKSALKKLKEEGFALFVISNQAGVSKGIFSQTNLNLITRNMLKELKAGGINIDGVYYCTHKPDDNCACRKPKTGLIEMAIANLKGGDISLSGSYFIGDTIRDMETGKAAGLKTILVFSGKEKPENKDNWNVLPDFTASGLTEAAYIILHHNLN
jgi:D-glycero-D-manno-heptose 1,7-bisphosphate phosphatase